NLLRTVMDNLPDHIFVKDMQSRFVTTNASHLRVLGVTTLDEVIGKTDFDFFPRELAERYFADEQAVTHSGQPLMNREEMVVESSGRQRWAMTTKLPLRDRGDQIIGIVGISHDITARKEAAEALRKAHDRLESLVAERTANL